MSNLRNKTKKKLPEITLSIEDRLKIFANMMVDRIMEEEAKYQERLKTDPKAKRIYEK